MMNLEDLRVNLTLKDSLGLDVDLVFKRISIEYEGTKGAMEEDGITPKKQTSQSFLLMML